MRCSSQQKDAVRQGLEQMDIIIRMIESAPDAFVFATTANGKESYYLIIFNCVSIYRHNIL